MDIANGVVAIWLTGKRLLWWVYLLFQPNHKCCFFFLVIGTECLVIPLHLVIAKIFMCQ
ncbi:hypothetical protein HanPSC8_Chr10g0434281 [Helianthus annuus]|nr:hypothetical protein HanPSC8_Chr10g0434281 [Helianthus annuus]